MLSFFHVLIPTKVKQRNLFNSNVIFFLQKNCKLTFNVQFSFMQKKHFLKSLLYGILIVNHWCYKM